MTRLLITIRTTDDPTAPDALTGFPFIGEQAVIDECAAMLVSLRSIWLAATTPRQRRAVPEHQPSGDQLRHRADRPAQRAVIMRGLTKSESRALARSPNHLAISPHGPHQRWG